MFDPQTPYLLVLTYGHEVHPSMHLVESRKLKLKSMQPTHAGTGDRCCAVRDK